VLLDVRNGAQRDFSLTVPRTRECTIYAAGKDTDIVLELCEVRVDGVGAPRYAQGADDVDGDKNASMTVRFYKGCKCVLRGRLVFAPARMRSASSSTSEVT
jgi:hypothetical protein